MISHDKFNTFCFSEFILLKIALDDLFNLKKLIHKKTGNSKLRKRNLIPSQTPSINISFEWYCRHMYVVFLHFSEQY